MTLRAPAHDAELHLPAEDVGVAQARDFTRRTLESWSYRGSVDDAVLVISELVTNALEHGEGRPLLRLSGSTTRIRVEVVDEGPGLPRLREPGADGGWGLRMAAQLAECWGTTARETGKTIWCEFVPELSAAPSR